MTGEPIFAVSLDSEAWLTAPQLVQVERVVLPWASSDRASAVTAFLQLAEATCLDTALLGMVIAHESGGYVNRLYWGEFGPTAKMEAGWPEGMWLPPAELDRVAVDVVRSRTRHPDDGDRAVDWAQWQLRNWWQFAAVLEPDAVLKSIDDAGTPVVAAARTSERASGSSVGEIIPFVEPDCPLPPDERCHAKWPVHVVSDRIREVQERQCIFPATSHQSICRMHSAVSTGS